MSGTSWTQKQINITITLGTGTFGSTSKNTVKLSNLRVVATIERADSPRRIGQAFGCMECRRRSPTKLARWVFRNR